MEPTKRRHRCSNNTLSAQRRHSIGRPVSSHFVALVTIAAVVLVSTMLFSAQPLHRADGKGRRDVALLDQDSLALWPGFPRRALTVQELALCDRLSNSVLSGATRCLVDTSCVTCLEPFVNRNRALLAQVSADLEYGAAFGELVEESFRGSSGGPIVLLAVNSGQVYLLLNWYLSVKANTELDPCSVALVIATDIRAYETVQAESCLRVYLVDGLGIRTTYSQNVANRGAHWAVNSVLSVAMKAVLQRGVDVLMQDVDVVWMRNPLPTLSALGRHNDVVCMYSQYLKETKGICNTGFVFSPSREKTKIFWGTVRNALEVKQVSDQSLFGQILRHNAFFALHIRPLPPHLFNKGGSALETQHTSSVTLHPETMVYHAVSVEKVNQLVEAGEWRYKPEMLVRELVDTGRASPATRTVFRFGNVTSGGDEAQVREDYRKFQAGPSTAAFAAGRGAIRVSAWERDRLRQAAD